MRIPIILLTLPLIAHSLPSKPVRPPTPEEIKQYKLAHDYRMIAEGLGGRPPSTSLEREAVKFWQDWLGKETKNGGVSASHRRLLEIGDFL